jgi:hypothetical protein
MQQFHWPIGRGELDQTACLDAKTEFGSAMPRICRGGNSSKTDYRVQPGQKDPAKSARTFYSRGKVHGLK